LPNIFQRKLTKDQFRVRFKFFQVFSSIRIEKEFLVGSLLDSSPVLVSNQPKKIIKQEFIEFVQLVQGVNLIENPSKIISHAKDSATDPLNVENSSAF
jgi:hypothetical protein